MVATVWNYVYNIGVDKLLLRYQGHTHKACGSVCCTPRFRGGLLIVALPVMSWWLDIGLLEALVLDMGFVPSTWSMPSSTTGAMTRCSPFPWDRCRRRWDKRFEG